MTRSTNLTVDGMTCASCVARVERALVAAPGVETAAVNLMTNTATVSYDPAAISPDALAAAVAKAGYAAHPQPETGTSAHDHHHADGSDLRRMVTVSAALTLPVVVLAMGAHFVPAFHHWLMANLGERVVNLSQLVLTAAVLFGPGLVFLKGGTRMLLKGAPDMNSLVALGSAAAFAYSTVVTLAPDLLPANARHIYFEAAAVIVTLILFGRLLEARAKGQAGEAIRRLIELRPASARVVRPSGTVEIPVGELRPGDMVQLAPGERVAVDGVVTEGHGWIDESMLTGESAPVEKQPGTAVTGGTVNGTAALTYRVTAVGADTVLARIVRMVSDAQATKLPVQAMVDRITLWFVPAVMALAVAAFVAWLLLGPEPRIANALVAGIAVLIIACPCAMGLATPVSILVGTGRGAELGVLFRRGDALQRLSEARIIAFDKTGTLTEGHPRLTGIHVVEGESEAEVLRLAASAEARSEHPLGRAIVQAASDRGLALEPSANVRSQTGRGITATVAGREVHVGSPSAVAEAGMTLGPLAATADKAACNGQTPIVVTIDGRAAAVLSVSDPLKPGSRDAIAALKAMGKRTVLISGDAKATAEAVGRALGVDHVEGEVLPEGKVSAVEALLRDGSVAFVGDGINDAPALAAADVGLAVGTGTDVAIESAEVVLMSGDPRAVAAAIRLSEATMRNIRQNLFWAFGYNVALIPVAAGALYPVTGTMLSPMLAAGAMALSSVFVVTNALRLRGAVPQAARASAGGSLAPVMKATASDIV